MLAFLRLDDIELLSHLRFKNEGDFNQHIKSMRYFVDKVASYGKKVVEAHKVQYLLK